MFRFLIQKKNLDGIGVAAGTPFNLLLMGAFSSSNQLDCGEFASVAAAKTGAVAIVKASLTWADESSGSTSAIFTT